MELDPWVIWQSAGFLAHGLALSLLLLVVGVAGGAALGAVLALARMSGVAPFALPAAGYVTVMRSVPLVLVLFWFYFMLPIVIGTPVGALPAALTAFVLFEAAFYCEIFRAGVLAVPRGQWSAAAASGLRPGQVLVLVVLPQAVAAMRPLLVNQVVILFQDTSLVYVVALRDFLTSASVVAGRDARPVELYGFVAVVYFILCFAGSQLAGGRRAVAVR